MLPPQSVPPPQPPLIPLPVSQLHSRLGVEHPALPSVLSWLFWPLVLLLLLWPKLWQPAFEDTYGRHHNAGVGLKDVDEDLSIGIQSRTLRHFRHLARALIGKWSHCWILRTHNMYHERRKSVSKPNNHNTIIFLKNTALYLLLILSHSSSKYILFLKLAILLVNTYTVGPQKLSGAVENSSISLPNNALLAHRY